MSATVNPELAALREQVNQQGKEISELRGGLQQLDKIVSATTRQSIWQLIALVISLSAAIVGGLAYQTNMIDKRIDLLERNEAIRYEALEKRIDQVEKNMNARFEDLKQ